MDWLSERGIVFRANKHLGATVNIQSVRKEGRGIVLESNENPATINIVRSVTAGEKSITAGQLIDALNDIACRLECEELRKSRRVDAVSLRAPSPKAVLPDSLHLRTGDVH